MVLALEKAPPMKKAPYQRNFFFYGISDEEFISKDLDSFVDRRTSLFFERLRLSINFLGFVSKFWSKNASYRNAREKLKTLEVVNDCSERVVRLTQDYAIFLLKMRIKSCTCYSALTNLNGFSKLK